MHSIVSRCVKSLCCNLNAQKGDSSVTLGGTFACKIIAVEESVINNYNLGRLGKFCSFSSCCKLICYYWCYWYHDLIADFFSSHLHVIILTAQELKESFNYGLFCPPSNGKAGKFLDEERRLGDYPFNGPVGYLEVSIMKLKRISWLVD